jgi:4-hydroxy-2-oxoheptanedioate aldolase
VTLVDANRRTHVFALIETRQGVDNVAEICAVEGLAGIFLGPGDLSFEMGKPGAFSSPELIQIIVDCITTAHLAGKRVGMFAAPSPVLSAALDAGCDIVVPGADIGYLATAWEKLLTTIPASHGIALPT